MKNQMGNNNVSGLQDEEKLSAVGDQEKLMTQEVHEVAVNGESHMTEEVKDNDFIIKVEELSPVAYSLGANDSHVQNQTLDEKEKEDTEEVPTEDLVAQTTEKEDTEEVPTEDLIAQTTEIEDTEEVQTKESVAQATEKEDTEEVPAAHLVAQATEEDTEEVRIKDLVGQTTKKEEIEEATSEDLVSESDNTQTKGSSKQEQDHNEYLEVPASSKLSSCKDKPLELTSERLDLGTNGPHSEQPLSFAKEELLGNNSALDSKFISGDDVDPKSDDQPEIVGSRDEQIGDSLAEIKEDELLHLNISTHYDQKDHLTDNKAAENLPVSVISNTSDQDVEKIMDEFIKKGNFPQEEKLSETTSTDEINFEIPQVDEDGDGLAIGEVEHVFSSDLGVKGELEMASSQEVFEAVPNKGIIHTEESKLLKKESEIGEDKYDSDETQFSEMKNSEFIASQSKNVTTGFDCNKNGKENASDSNSSPEMESFNQIEEAKVDSGASLMGSNLNSVISKNFEVVAEEVPEVRTVLTALTLVEPNQKQENSAEKGLGRISAEPNEETSGNQVELRKSPSFDFGLPLGARYEESDETPLLCLDKASSASLSSRDTLTFQKATAKNQYGRDQLPYEVVVVEEKTIRMERSDSERSDSDKPRAPFMSLLKKEGKANAFVELEQEEAPLTEEVVSTSNKGSGKHKQRASLFSTCICCATSIP